MAKIVCASPPCVGRCARGCRNAIEELSQQSRQLDHEHVWVTALDGDNQPALNEAGATWQHCGICGNEMGLDPKTKDRIRREAYAYAANELDAVRDWERNQERYPDPYEREEFEIQISRITQELRKKA